MIAPGAIPSTAAHSRGRPLGARSLEHVVNRPRLVRTTAAASAELLLVASLVFVARPAALSGQEPALTVRVLDFESDAGKVNIALFDSAESFTRTAVRSAIRPIEGLEAEWRVEGLPAGDYAIALFHDENGNGKLDKKIFGLPREPYAFSNGARIRFGPPKWEKARFTYAGDESTIEIRFD